MTRPTAADYAEAERFVAEEYDAGDYCRTWLANHRAKLVRYAADAAMQKRMATPVTRAIDDLFAIETDNMRWLKIAAEKLREDDGSDTRRVA